MSDHRDVLARIAPQDMARLRVRSDRAGLVHLGQYLGALGLCSFLIALQVPLWPLLLLPQGILLVFLFTLSHEATHRTPFAKPWLSDLAGHLIAPILALPFIWFRYFHLAHHKHTNDPELDPEIAGQPRPGDWRSFAIYLSGWLYWRGMAALLWQNAFRAIDAPYLPLRQHSAMRREARMILAAYVLAGLSLLASPLLLWLWFVPVLIGQPFLRLYLLAEHGLCPPVANMLENTRTTFTNRLVRWLAWNMPYHIEHHAAPDVPFHQLPTLHDLMREDLGRTSPGYRAFAREYVGELGG